MINYDDRYKLNQIKMVIDDYPDKESDAMSSEQKMNSYKDVNLETESDTKHISYDNPETVEISEGKQWLHKPEYFRAVSWIQHEYSSARNVPFGEFAVAVCEAELDNYRPIWQIIDTLIEGGSVDREEFMYFLLQKLED